MEKLDNQKVLTYIDRTQKNERINLLNSIPLSGPLMVHLEPTNICNFKCKFCPESLNDYEDKAGGFFNLSLENFIKILNELKKVPKLKSLNFFMMGEPFVNKNILKFVKMASSANISETYMISSNGVLLTKEKYSDLCESGLNYLRISIFGSNEITHFKATQNKVKLSRVRENILNFKKFKEDNSYLYPRILVKMIKSDVEEENEEFLREFNGTGDEILLEPLTNWNDPDDTEFYKVDNKKIYSTDHYSKRKKVCPYPFYSLVIHSDLKVSICCVDWEKKTVIGDLNKENLPDIWNGESLRNIQLKHIQGRKKDVEGCKNCSYLHTTKDNIDALDEETFKSRKPSEVFVSTP